MPKIKVEPLGLSLNVTQTEGLLKAFKRAKVDLVASCGGQGNCGTCAVKISERGAALTPMQADELSTLQNSRKDPTQYRLSCQTYVLEDGAVFQLNAKESRKLNQILERLKNRRAPHDITHPVTRKLLVKKDGIITQSILECLLST